MATWSFFYQYSIGSAFFAAGLLLLVRAKAIDLSQARGRRTLALLVGGLTLYAVAHAVSVFVLPGT